MVSQCKRTSDTLYALVTTSLLAIMILNLEDGKSQSIMTLDVFLLILRLLLIVLLYLFLMQVVIAITRDLRKTSAASEGPGNKALPVVGHLIVVDSGPSNILPGTRFDLVP